MCRWLAYSGAPILLTDVVYEGPNSLVSQSLHSRLGAEPTNGDGFELAGHVSSPRKLYPERTTSHASGPW
jgi:predicted glutamine amidotransferase